MKKKSYFVMLLALACFTQSCKDDAEDLNSFTEPVKSAAAENLNLRALFSENHVIPVSEASEIALNAPDMFASESTRANDLNPRTIESIGVYGRPKSSLRSANVSEDSLIYVFNYADNRGFAIVAADDRIPTQILAYVDEGSLENEVDNPALQYALEQMQSYVEASVDAFEESKDSLLAVADEYTFAVDDKAAETRAINAGTTITTVNETTVGPLIKVTWGQSYPYNMFVPVACTDNGYNGGKAPVGCVATATAQVMSYWKYPTTIDWNTVCATKEAPTSNQQLIASLMYTIGQILKMDSDCDGSGAQTSDAYDMLAALGYTKWASKTFDATDALTALKINVPIMVSGCRTKKTTSILWWDQTSYSNCHAWVVDGYKEVRYKIENYRVDTSTGEYNSTVAYTNVWYFHNNWGWSGSGNGYFAAGCFDLTNALSYDNGIKYSAERNYQYKNKMFVVFR